MSSLAQVCTAYRIPVEAEGKGTLLNKDFNLQSLICFFRYWDTSEETCSLSNCLSIKSLFRLISVPAFSSLKAK